MGVTSAIFQTLAKVLDEQELFIICVSAGSMAGKLSFKTLAEILSYPGALFEGKCSITCLTSC